MNKVLLLLGLALCFLSITTTKSMAACCPEGSAQCLCETGCALFVAPCSASCGACSALQEPLTNFHFDTTIDNHRDWMIDVFWGDRVAGNDPGLLAAMMLMAEQLTANAIQQVEIIGTFFDAKHQLETQRLFQTLTARAHKDYHPSEELCEVATATRSLASSERSSDLAAMVFSKRQVARQLLSRDTLEAGGVETDQRSRLVQFIQRFCNPNDNSGNLDFLCLRGNVSAENRNRDINYTSTLDKPLTLDIDVFNRDITDDEEAVFALNNNLIAHETMPIVERERLMSRVNNVPGYDSSAFNYLDSRALVAKRSVAANSLASITALKVAGDPQVEPFIYAIIQELSGGNFSLEEIQNIIGERPSYYAQMEILTKKLYQHPNFYAELYDKPANVLRKDVAIQATDLMQKRDIFRSLLRSEAVLATILETALIEEQETITSKLTDGTEANNAGP